MAKFFGFNAPFLTKNGKLIERQVDDRLIKNDLLQLLLTAPGERVMRPDFGTGIRPYLFELIDDNGIQALKDNIKAAVEKFERRVTLADVVIVTDPGHNLVTIKVYGKFATDRFTVNGPPVTDSDLLVQLNIPTATMNRLT